MASERRTVWTDERLDERMSSIERTSDLLREEVAGLRQELREEMRETRRELSAQILALRSDFVAEMSSLRMDHASLRSDFAALQGRLIQIGWSLVGVLLAGIVAALVALA